jgi:hypothetical protein
MTRIDARTRHCESAIKTTDLGDLVGQKQSHEHRQRLPSKQKAFKTNKHVTQCQLHQR